MKRLFIDLSFLFRPSFWLMNHSYNKRWDEFISYIIDNRIEPIEIHEFAMTIRVDGEKDTSVWLENYPYAYGVVHGDALRVRPSRYNIVRLNKYITDYQLNKHLQ